MYFNDLSMGHSLGGGLGGLNPYCNGCTSMINVPIVYYTIDDASQSLL